MKSVKKRTNTNLEIGVKGEKYLIKGTNEKYHLRLYADSNWKHFWKFSAEKYSQNITKSTFL